MSYHKKFQEEISHYKDQENVHDLPSIFHYWRHRHLRPKFQSLGFSDSNEFFLQHIAEIAARRPEAPCEILSVGSGNCDAELALAKALLAADIRNGFFTCLEVNPFMLARGRQLASDSHLTDRFRFLETDISNWDNSRQYQVIIANQSLHHFVELETLFDSIYRSLDDGGFFLTNDMIGRNGHMRWPEALESVLALWSLLDDRHKWNHQLHRFEAVYENWDCSREGFEGIRAQDILPLLIERFKFHCFVGFANLINVFIDRGFGPNFDVQNPYDCDFIDFVAGLDDHYIETGRIKPTQMLAAMTKEQLVPTRTYRHLTPEYCVRSPEARPAE